MSGPMREARRTGGAAQPSQARSTGLGTSEGRGRRSAAAGEEGCGERAGEGIAGVEARGEIRDAPADGVEGIARQLAARPRGGGGVVAEERTAAEGARGVDAAATLAREKRARSGVRE